MLPLPPLLPTPGTTTIIDSIASATDSTAAAITAAIVAASAVSASVARRRHRQCSPPLLSPPPPDLPEQPPPPPQPPIHHVARRRTLHTAPTPTHLWAPPTDQISPAARTDYPTPRFHAYCPHCADSNYLALVQERASGMVCNVQVRALWSCGSDAPRLGLRACRLAIEWPLAPPPEPLSVAKPGIADCTSSAIRSRRAQLYARCACRCD